MKTLGSIKVLALFLALAFSLPRAATAQSLEITDVQFRSDSVLVDVFFSIRSSSGKVNLNSVYDDLSITETRESKNLEMQKNYYDDLKTTRHSDSESSDDSPRSKKDGQQLTISIVLDHSGSMRKHMLDKAKIAVRRIVEMGDEKNLPDGSIWFSTFHNEISSKQILTSSNVEGVLNSVNAHKNPRRYDTDLNNAIVEKLAELQGSNREGKKVLIVLTDGRHDIRKMRNRSEARKKDKGAGQTDVYEDAKNTEVAIYTIGLGNKVDKEFLKKIPDFTPNPNDGYSHADVPDDLKGIFVDIVESASADYKITLKSNFDRYTGLERTICFSLVYQGESVQDCITYSAGSSTNIIEVPEEGQAVPDKSIAMPLLVGIFALLLIFIGAVIIYPKLLLRNFERKYVKKYKPDDEGVTQECGWCRGIIEKGELVVMRCEHLQHKDCWDDEGHKCFEYPQRCEKGKFDKAFSVGDFFDQKGDAVHLNWMFFGAIAMFFAFALYTLIDTQWGEAYKDFMLGLIQTFTGQEEDYIRQNLLGSYSADTLTGLISGGMLGLFFSYVEEKRNQMQAGIYLKIFLKTVAIALVGFIVFYIGAALAKEINMDYISQFVAWSIFGVAMGLTLSIKSSIATKNGLIGGLIASAVAFQALFFITYIMPSLIGKIISFIIFGAVLGSIISVVNAMLEKFSLKILQASDKKWQGRDIAIHKWMKSGRHVTIGGSVDNHVYLNWEDNIPERVAELSLDSDRAYMKLLVDEQEFPVMIDGRILNTRRDHQLQDGCVIQIGDTKLKYFEGDEE